MKHDAQEATRSIVRVMCSPKNWGCGFVAAGQYVITAAHCLPRIPRHLFHEAKSTITSWDGNDEARLTVIYCDLMSDIAVLGYEPLPGSDLPQTEAFDRLVSRTGSARIDLSFPVEMPLRFYIRTHKGVWVSGSTEVLIRLAPMFSAFIDEGKKIPAGTSGSPVFNQKGEVMGLVSHGGEGGGTNSVAVITWLAGALQGWHIRELDEWQKEQEAPDEIN
jgi:hypothetical protein